MLNNKSDVVYHTESLGGAYSLSPRDLKSLFAFGYFTVDLIYFFVDSQ